MNNQSECRKLVKLELYINNSGHMTTMAAMPINGKKNHLKIFRRPIYSTISIPSPVTVRYMYQQILIVNLSANGTDSGSKLSYRVLVQSEPKFHFNNYGRKNTSTVKY